MTIVDTTTLGELVAARPETARTLDRHGLDYCCHGQRTLAEACRAAGLDPAAVAAELEAEPAGGDASWAALPAPELADHIVATHHRYLREELPALEALAGKVATVHGERHAELAEVERLVVMLRADLEPHLDKEERVLFPAIHALAAGRRAFPFGTVGNPIRVMASEHDAAGDLLARLRAVTGGYAVPADGCASYQALYGRLAELELDTHRHIHKENHSLFPAALALSETPA